ncbi:MAG: amidohydrolase [Sediminibacterium sp.]
MRIDAHQHFWKYNAGMTWITPEMSSIRKDFLPGDLLPLLQQHEVDGCVAVQADQTMQETEFLLQLAETHAFIKGIVGWVDLRAVDIHEQLSAYRCSGKLKGFRHVLQGETPLFMLQPAFMQGIKALSTFGYTYDILVYPHHLKTVLRLAEQFPDQAFVIDHMAKPFIKEGTMEEWRSDMQAIAAHENVYCKLSGMVTEADWGKWKTADFVPYLDVVTEAFGTGRVMYGSDWPVCEAAASYAEVMGIVKDYFFSFSAGEQAAVFGENATRFYHLS